MFTTTGELIGVFTQPRPIADARQKTPKDSFNVSWWPGKTNKVFDIVIQHKTTKRIL